MESDEKYRRWHEARQKYDERMSTSLSDLGKTDFLIEDVLQRFSEDQGLPLITYEELSNIDFNEWFPVSDGVRFKRIKHPEKPVLFLAEMNPAVTEDGVAEFGIQKHDCKELCTIREGHLIEILERSKLYTKGEQVIYPTFYMHKPSAFVFSVYEVEFILEKL